MDAFNWTRCLLDDEKEEEFNRQIWRIDRKWCITHENIKWSAKGVFSSIYTLLDTLIHGSVHWKRLKASLKSWHPPHRCTQQTSPCIFAKSHWSATRHKKPYTLADHPNRGVLDWLHVQTRVSHQSPTPYSPCTRALWKSHTTSHIWSICQQLWSLH